MYGIRKPSRNNQWQNEQVTMIEVPHKFADIILSIASALDQGILSVGQLDSIILEACAKGRRNVTIYPNWVQIDEKDKEKPISQDELKVNPPENLTSLICRIEAVEERLKSLEDGQVVE